MLVASRTKNQHELSSQFLLDVSEVIIENTEIQDNKLSEVLENIENINDKSSQLTILNEVFIDNIGNIKQDLSLRENTAKDQSEDTNEDNKSNGDDKSKNNNSETFKDYSCLFFEPYQDSDVTPTPINDNNKFLWILIWIIKF
ncbi:hypothetical protein RhiirC2_792606 [Rhizophagus irregularis]|uniref:Uncharacterized protein n=1 Tax=Rhizophagus irregularis TaxID=588596 RepID=A0A2N1MH07_9GLOM|nr:hypothetical protein RhiirC2_792606 [Rhizophagus irregularis]